MCTVCTQPFSQQPSPWYGPNEIRDSLIQGQKLFTKGKEYTQWKNVPYVNNIVKAKTCPCLMLI